MIFPGNQLTGLKNDYDGVRGGETSREMCLPIYRTGWLKNTRK
jgi:hypothetical protein